MGKVWVKNAASPLKKLMVSPPKFYWPQAIHESARNWMMHGEAAQNDALVREWQEMQTALREAGAEVIEVAPDRRLQLQALARDFGACVREGVVMGHFRHPARQKEVKVYEKRLRELGIPVIARCSAGCFEGGDFTMLDEHTLAIAVSDRTDKAGLANLREQLCNYGYTVTSVPVAPANVHLDTVFNVVAERTAIALCRELPYGFAQMLKRRGFTVLDAAGDITPRHACDALGLGNGKVLVIAENREVNEKLKALGLSLLEVSFEKSVLQDAGPHRYVFPLERW